MNIHDWITIFGSIFVFEFGAWSQRRRDRKEKPYRWKCPEKGCVFFVTGNDAPSVLRISRNHERVAHDKV